jgi:hypothetical protein
MPHAVGDSDLDPSLHRIARLLAIMQRFHQDATPDLLAGNLRW